MQLSRSLYALPLVLFLISCATAQPRNRQGLSVNSTEVVGWADLRGEWAVYATRSEANRSYASLRRPPECLNLVNATGIDREQFRMIHGKYVRAVGNLTRYDDIPDATAMPQAILSVKVYNGEPVHNSCLNDNVFIVRALIEVG